MCNCNRSTLSARGFGEYTQRAAGVAPTRAAPTHSRDTMLLTRFRSALLVAACALLCGPGRPDDKTAPSPRPVKDPAQPEKKAPVVTDREQIRKELEAKLAGRTPEQIGAILDRLAQEWSARKG